ncbi:MAG: hypothetical protein NTU41_01380, partial [Chloroflexi bacterium]|nr:hypothetical protein [Chloroflexota bacterium]
MSEEVGGTQHTSQVNLLANLIRWIAVARKDIGINQLPVFLETYGMCGHLAPGLKEAIVRLAEVIDEAPSDADVANVWSQLTLELHGILVGGGGSLRPLASLSEEKAEDNEPPDTAEAGDGSADEPLKLKLVFPGSSGKGERE